MKRILFTVFAFVVMSAFWKVQPVFAGTDISVSCNLITCTTTPNSVPLFNEPNIWPGYSVTQIITATNTTDENGELGLDTTPFYQEETQVAAFLPTSIFVEIHRGSANGPIVYGGGSLTLYDLFQAHQVDLGQLSPNQTEQYFFKATLSSDINNEFQQKNILFDLDLGFNFTPVPNTPQVQGTSNSNNGGGGGTNTYSCGDTAPSVAPELLSVSAAGTQAVLTWTAVSGADHYAINFGVQPGVYLYGNNNVGNVTTYVVSGLAPGTKYYFQVIGINGCAPGPRSGEVSNTGTQLPTGSQVGAPNGFTPEQVLGATTDTSQEEGKKDGEVLGATADCVPWKPYLPFIFIAMQVIGSLVVYVFMRSPDNKFKQIVVVIVVIVSTALFYFLRNCDCAQPSFIALLCKWYFVMALVMAAITQFINYALIEREE